MAEIRPRWRTLRGKADVAVQAAVIGGDLAGAGVLPRFGQKAGTGQDELTQQQGEQDDP